MTRLARSVVRIALGLGAMVTLVAASLLLAMASVGLFATSGDAWTAELRLAGAHVKFNVIGAMRLATLPGVAHLLDGHSFNTRAGTVGISREGGTLRIRCAPCRVQHADLASLPVDIRAVVLDVRRDEDRLEGALAIDEVRVAFQGRLRSGSADLAWQLPSTGLSALYRALGEAVPEAAFARIEGTVQAEGTLSLPSRQARVTWTGEGWEVGGLGTEHLQSGAFRFACKGPAHANLVLTGDGERGWVAGDAMGPYLAAAVLAAEDQRFLRHPGYDEQAIGPVLADIEGGRPQRGASTITQQLARTLFAGGERTAARKLRELLYAIEMERTLGKTRILELYLNTVDWGPGICGAKAAARAYFGKTPARLTPIEAAWLAGVLRHPRSAWEQRFTAEQPHRERAIQVLMQMRDWPKRERHRMAMQPLVFGPAPSAERLPVVTRRRAASSNAIR